MFFKNLIIYRAPKNITLTDDILQEKLAHKALQPCGELELKSVGWVSANPDGRLAYLNQGQALLAMGVEQKIVPASAAKRIVQNRTKDIEAQQGFKMGRKQIKELKEQVHQEMLPRAFSAYHTTHAWLDMVNGFLVVDASSSTKAEDVLSLFYKTFDDLQVLPLTTEVEPIAAMTDWLAHNQAPIGFTIDQDLELRDAGEGKATVRYANHTLEGDEIHEHIAQGKRSTRLGMTWQDRISFTLTENLQIKRLAFLDLSAYESEMSVGNEADKFDAEFKIMTGQLSKLMHDLFAVLGGLKEGKEGV